MGRFMRKEGWGYQDELEKEYGAVCKQDDLFGVGVHGGGASAVDLSLSADIETCIIRIRPSSPPEHISARSRDIRRVRMARQVGSFVEFYAAS